VKRAGKVWLIGAGPGDPELLTLKAARALGEADVLLVDDLANPAVLAHARPGARVVPVGKRGGCRSTPQAFIEKLMIRCARRGLTVARVKGGDPFVFGRGGEEMLALAAAGIKFEIAGGITAGMGAAAAFGIPLTHRDMARGVAFVTGHTRDGAPPDWHALVAARTTLVIYMGITRCAQIMDALLAAGLAPDTPAAAIQNATLATERCIIAGAAGLARAVASAGLGSPAVLVIGEVVRLARQTQIEPRIAPEDTCPQPHAA
jgi:uroporphyrin-III C-methyltransferase